MSADFVRKKICLFDSQGNALQKVARVKTDLTLLPTNSSLSFLEVANNNCVFVRTTEHPEILDDRSKGEAANRFSNWLDGVIR